MPRGDELVVSKSFSHYLVVPFESIGFDESDVFGPTSLVCLSIIILPFLFGFTFISL